MRIIAGQRRGHKIDGPRAAARTRPTSDLVRESLFNILGDLVVDRVVIDLFAGTGALGLEALSRGARHAIFVEIDRECIGLIIKNVQALRYEDRARVRHADAYRWARTFEPEGTDPVVVLLDPPYVDYERRHKLLNQTIAHVVERLPGGSVIVLEAGQGLNDRILPLVETWDVRRYGNTQVAIKMIESAAMDAVASPDDAERASGANRDRSETEDDLRR